MRCSVIIGLSYQQSLLTLALVLNHRGRGARQISKTCWGDANE